MKEIWIPVEARPDFYQVSDAGRVRSVRKNGRFFYLKLHVDKWGYHEVGLALPDGHFDAKVHRLVAAAFLDGDRSLPVLHGDGNPTNNIPSNLRYGTIRENNQDTVRHGRNYQANKSQCIHGHLFTDDNTYRANARRSCRSCNRIAAAQYKARRILREIDRKGSAS